jgi:hypothetical protein
MLFAGLMVVLVCGLGGCAKSKQEALMDEAMAALNELCDIVESVNDDASARTAVPKIEQVGARMKDLGQRWRIMGSPPSEEAERLRKKYAEPQEKLTKRFLDNQTKFGKYPVLAQPVMKAMFEAQLPVGPLFPGNANPPPRNPRK